MVLWFAGFIFAACGWADFGFVLHFRLFFVTMVGCGLWWCVSNNGGLWVTVMGL